MRRKLARLVVGLIAIACVAAVLVSERNKAIDRLYGESLWGTESFTGTGEEGVAKIRALAGYRGRRVTGLLLEIAMTHEWPKVQAEAISALTKRNDPDVPPRWAKLLQPHVRLYTGQRVAEALRTMPCEEDCTRRIVHYLELIWRGEPNEEDRRVFPTGTEELRAFQLNQQELLYDTLRQVLKQEKAATLTTLALEYGLGSSHPSTFALDLVSRLNLAEACPLLRQTEKIIQSTPSGLYNHPTNELNAALAALECPS